MDLTKGSLCPPFTGVDRGPEGACAARAGEAWFTGPSPTRRQTRCGATARDFAHRASCGRDVVRFGWHWVLLRPVATTAPPRHAEHPCLSAAARGWRATTGLPGGRGQNGV